MFGSQLTIKCIIYRVKTTEYTMSNNEKYHGMKCAIISRVIISKYNFKFQSSTFITPNMAPGKDPKRQLNIAEKELTLWPVCQKAERVPPGYVSLCSADRNFGFSFKV